MWLALFFLAPFVFVARISLSQSVLGQPPYAPVFSFADGVRDWLAKLSSLSLDAYQGLGNSIYWRAYIFSVVIAGLATLAALAIGFPFALALVRAPKRWRPTLLGLAMAPFWTSFLIRVYAWIMLLKDEGLINHALKALGLIEAPLPLFANNGAVIAGIVYSYLPFMILPLYNALESQDEALSEVAADLGAGPWRAFWSVTVPLAAPGVWAGCLLVFIPAVGEFVIPDLLGGANSLMIGKVMWNEFFENRDWPTACAAAVALLTLLAAPLALYERAQMREGAP